MSSTKAQDKPKPYAIRVYINDPKQVRPTLRAIDAAAKLVHQSRSSFILAAALERAERKQIEAKEGTVLL
jgi:uncharacterized protein (DUF1778 family)